MLRAYLKQLNRNQGLLFTTASGKPINPRFLIKSFKEAIKEAGLPEIRFHDLRHTSATLLLLANVNPRVVQERLGHSSVTLTLSTYSHILPAMQDEAAEKLERILEYTFSTPYRLKLSGNVVLIGQKNAKSPSDWTDWNHFAERLLSLNQWVQGSSPWSVT